MLRRNFVMRAICVFHLLIVPVAAGHSQIQLSMDDAMKLERRIDAIETTQALQIEALQSSNLLYQWIVGAIGTFLAIFVGFLTFYQFVISPKRQKERDTAELTSVRRISEIMSVVKQTLEARLTAEEDARKKAEVAQKKMEEMRVEMADVQEILKRFTTIYKGMGAKIEEKARFLAMRYRRHDFRYRMQELQDLRLEYHRYLDEYYPMQGEEVAFSARVPYLLGIAAHYMNMPEEALGWFNNVVNEPAKLSDEDDRAYDRRRANCYYYMGVTSANFGDLAEAIQLFEQADALDGANDVLTKVVKAETYIMNRNFEEGDALLEEVENDISEKKNQLGRLPSYHLRLQSRGRLVQANMIIARRTRDWTAMAKTNLMRIYEADPFYYYGTVTLGQIYREMGEIEEAKTMFRRGYDEIVGTGDLSSITEVRTAVLINIIAAMGALHGYEDGNRASVLLDRAEELCDNLPRMGQKVCTVYSALSKTNEKSDRILNDIERIRSGRDSLVGEVT